MTPERVLQELLAGNRRFASNQLTSIQHGLDLLKSRMVNKPEPIAAVLACADSRVPVELLFDQTIGQLFVTRVAGNLVTPEVMASLEFAVAILSVKVVLVLGHTNCGLVTAAMTAQAVPGRISSLYPAVQRAVEASDGNVTRAIQVNATVQADLLRTSSAVIREAEQSARITVASGVYDLASGMVNLI